MPLPLYFHVGPPKTGTTYVQQLLWKNREQLLEQGILYPANDRGHHFHAAFEIVDVSERVNKEAVQGCWDDLLTLVRRHDGPAVISHERFAVATTENAARVVADLADRELHIVLTARDALGMYESLFQQGIKHGRTWTFDSYAETTLFADPTAGMTVGMLGPAMQTWGTLVPPERVHVVVMPPPGASRTLLFERFCDVLGFDPSGAVLETTRVNESIGVVEAELLSRLNARRGDDWWPPAGRYVKHRLVPRLLAGRDGQRRVRVTDPKVLDALLEETRLLVSAIRERGFQVVGDLDELEAAHAAKPTDHGPEVTEQELLDLALDSLSWCAVHGAELEAENKGLIKRIRKLRDDDRG